MSLLLAVITLICTLHLLLIVYSFNIYCGIECIQNCITNVYIWLSFIVVSKYCFSLQVLFSLITVQDKWALTAGRTDFLLYPFTPFPPHYIPIPTSVYRHNNGWVRAVAWRTSEELWTELNGQQESVWPATFKATPTHSRCWGNQSEDGKRQLTLGVITSIASLLRRRNHGLKAQR